MPWIYGIVDAVTVANEICNGASESATVPPGYLLLAIKFGIVPFNCVYFGGIFFLLTGFVGLIKLLLQLD